VHNLGHLILFSDVIEVVVVSVEFESNLGFALEVKHTQEPLEIDFSAVNVSEDGFVLIVDLEADVLHEVAQFLDVDPARVVDVDEVVDAQEYL